MRGNSFTTSYKYSIFRSRHRKVFLEKGVLKICSNFTGEHRCWSVISTKLQSSFIEIALQHECSSVNLLHILRTPQDGCFWTSVVAQKEANIDEKQFASIKKITPFFSVFEIKEGGVSKSHYAAVGCDANCERV